VSGKWELLKAIAEAALGEEVSWVARVGLNLLAQRPDNMLDEVNLTGICRPLYVVEQPLGGDRPAGVAGERF